MSAFSKAKLKRIVPPLLLDFARKFLNKGIVFSGSYPTWELAEACSTGYDSVEILSRVVAATRKVESGESAYERDSVTFDHIEYSWPLLASLLQVALERQSLRVIDFGGSLGSTWRQNRRYLERLKVPMTWHVVEQAEFVAVGRAEFQTDVLRFSDSIAQAESGGVDVILFCSSLCYLPDPAGLLRQCANSGAKYLIIDRLPIVKGEQDLIAVQTVSEPIYQASYPIRLFSENLFLPELLGDWSLIEKWECDLQPDPNSRYWGFFLEKR